MVQIPQPLSNYKCTTCQDIQKNLDEIFSIIQEIREILEWLVNDASTVNTEERREFDSQSEEEDALELSASLEE